MSPVSPKCPHGMGPRRPHVTQMPIWDDIEVSPNVTQCHPEAHTGQDPDVPSVTHMSPMPSGCPKWDP